VAATQRPAAALVGGMVKANFPVRLVGSVTSPEDAKVAAGIAGTEAERLLGRGDFLVVAKGQVIRFQAAYASAAEMAEAMSRIHQGGRRRRTWQVEPAQPVRKGMLERGRALRALPGGSWAQ
jgi:S-DNA-T family DNA segregation ATPase FtsK/SpoIIIE